MKLHIPIDQFAFIELDLADDTPVEELVKIYERLNNFPLKAHQAKQQLSASERIKQSKKAKEEIILTPEEL